MSGSFPNTKGFQTMNWTSNQINRMTVSVSGKRQVANIGDMGWSFTLKSPVMERADFMADYAFLMKQRGGLETFTIVPPTIGSASGTMTGTVNVSSASSTDPSYGPNIGSTAVGITSGSGTFKAGDLIKFSGHDKVYMVVSDCSRDGSSIDRLEFEPKLRAAVGGNTITYDDVPIKVYLDEDEISFSVGVDNLYEYSIALREEI